MRCRRYSVDILSPLACVSTVPSLVQMCMSAWLRSLLHILRSIAPRAIDVAAGAVVFRTKTKASFAFVSIVSRLCFSHGSVPFLVILTMVFVFSEWLACFRSAPIDTTASFHPDGTRRAIWT